MRFLVADIRNAGRFDKTESLDPLSFLGKPPEFVHFQNPLKVTASAMMTGSEILVTGTVSTTLGFTCGRCVERFDRPYSAEFQQVFSVEEVEIDVSSDIQETVLIDLPLIPVCRDDCKGLCATCGKNKNFLPCSCKQLTENPKWDALKEFRVIKK